MTDVFILSASRSPIGRFGGALSSLSPVDLAAPILRSAVDSVGIPDRYLDLILIGHVLKGGHGQLVARQAAKCAKIADSVDAVSVDMVCSSGMMSVILGVSMIQSGAANFVLAGGVESMSSAGFALSSKARWGYKYLSDSQEPILDLLHRDGLSDPIRGESMGVQAERLAQQRRIPRQELDEISAESHTRAYRATISGIFSREITPINGKEGILKKDEGIRSKITAKSLAKLSPVFAKDGLLTAGNSSQISDGSAAILLASTEFVKNHRVDPIAKILGSGWSAGAWDCFLESPVNASNHALRSAGLDASDINLYENNEAFSLSTSLYLQEMGLPPEVLNVNGGAIALGHPIGCSGTRIIVTLLHALQAYEQSLGLATLCHGTGGATAVIVERC